MFLIKNKQKIINARRKVTEEPEVVEAREYLDKTHPTLTGRDSPVAGLLGRLPFEYLGSSKKDEYTRYHFCEGKNRRIIYVALCNEEREKIIKLFNESMKKTVKDYVEEFVYKDSLKGMFIGDEVKHRFFSHRSNIVAFMSDDGEISLPPILQSEDMD